tara:strand:+ start:8684 stop:10168 length:1485 start_codon:yes stop_codon:yes gene_type:complete
MAVTITVANITTPDMSETSLGNTWVSQGGNWVSRRHEGVVLEGQSTLVADYTITADANYHLAPAEGGTHGVEVFWVNRISNSAWEPYYSWVVTSTNYTATGKTHLIQSSNFKVFYTPPVSDVLLNPDPLPPEGGFDAHLHDIRFSYDRQPIIASTSKLVTIGVHGHSSDFNQVEPYVYAPGAMVGIVMNANGTGNVTMSVRKLNEAKTDYTHSYNFSNGTFIAKSSGLQTKTQTFTTENLSLLEAILFPTTQESKLYSVVYSAGTLALDAKIPDALNEFNIRIAQLVSGTFTPGAKTNITVSSGVTSPSGLELLYNGDEGPTVAFTFVYTKSSGTLSLTRQPVQSDVTGAFHEIVLGDAVSQGATDYLFDDTTGLKPGMKVEDTSFLEGNKTASRIPADALGNTPVLNAVTANTKITIKGAEPPYSAVAATAAFSETEFLTISSDWIYRVENILAVINEGATAVTVTGKLRVIQFGKSSPNGNIVLQPNFLTIS